MPVFTKRIENATSVIQAIEPLDILRSLVPTSLNASGIDSYAVLYPYSLNASSATSFIRITKPLGYYATSFVRAI